MEFIIIIVGLILDRLTKFWAVKQLASGNDIVILKDIFSLSYLENRGAAFGILQNKQIILIIITVCIMAGMLFYLIKYKPDSKLLRVSIGLIISGAIGNMIDRATKKYVVDFITVHYKEHYFPTFNVADMLVVVGTCLLAIYIIKDGK